MAVVSSVPIAQRQTENQFGLRLVNIEYKCVRRFVLLRTMSVVSFG
jgi:hypothetical protein